MDPPTEQSKVYSAEQDLISSNPHRPTSVVDEPKAEMPVPQIRRPLPRPVFSELVTPQQSCVFEMDLLSPSKALDVNMESSPYSKRSASDNHTGLTPGMANLQPSKAKRLKTSETSMPEEILNDDFSTAVDSPIRPRKMPRSKTESSLQANKSVDSPFLVPTIPKIPYESKSAQLPANDSPFMLNKLPRCSSDIRPCKLFSDSPKHSPSKIEAMMDEIEVGPMDDSGSEDFLRRQKKKTFRRFNSFDLRREFADMSNTPTSSFKSTRSRNLEDQEEPHSERENEKIWTREEDAIDESEHERIKSAVDVLQCASLIADGSRTYCLPVVPGKHSDLKYIHHDTLAGLLRSTLMPDIEKLTLIDCRYPYEYNGGHIKGAINIYTTETMTEFLNDEIEQPASLCGKHVLMFYCEFSSQRGPGMYRHLRSSDRQKNVQRYPELTFPEVYCAFGGYKEFFHQHPDLCDPPCYTPMVDEKYASDLRHFRSKARSWAAGEKLKALQRL